MFLLIYLSFYEFKYKIKTFQFTTVIYSMMMSHLKNIFRILQLGQEWAKSSDMLCHSTVHRKYNKKKHVDKITIKTTFSSHKSQQGKKKSPAEMEKIHPVVEV